jgi:hypothetical protein
MKQVNLLLMSAAMTLASCGGTKDAGQQQDAAALIQRSDIKIEGKRMTPEALWAMGRIGSRISRRKANCLHGILLQRAPEQE